QRGAAAMMLIATSSDVGVGTAELAALLDSADPRERASGLRELAMIAGDARVAALRAKLDALLRDPDARVREAAAIAVGKLGADARAFLPVLRERLRIYSLYAEWKGIADTLVALGPAAAPAFPDLVDGIHRYSNSETLIPALVSIVRTTPGTAEQLRAALADEGYWVRSIGARVLELAAA